VFAQVFRDITLSEFGTGARMLKTWSLSDVLLVETTCNVVAVNVCFTDAMLAMVHAAENDILVLPLAKDIPRLQGKIQHVRAGIQSRMAEVNRSKCGWRVVCGQPDSVWDTLDTVEMLARLLPDLPAAAGDTQKSVTTLADIQRTSGYNGDPSNAAVFAYIIPDANVHTVRKTQTTQTPEPGQAVLIGWDDWDQPNTLTMQAGRNVIVARICLVYAMQHVKQAQSPTGEPVFVMPLDSFMMPQAISSVNGNVFRRIAHLKCVPHAYSHVGLFSIMADVKRVAMQANLLFCMPTTTAAVTSSTAASSDSGSSDADSEFDDVAVSVISDVPDAWSDDDPESDNVSELTDDSMPGLEPMPPTDTIAKLTGMIAEMAVVTQALDIAVQTLLADHRHVQTLLADHRQIQTSINALVLDAAQVSSPASVMASADPGRQNARVVICARRLPYGADARRCDVPAGWRVHDVLVLHGAKGPDHLLRLGVPVHGDKVVVPAKPVPLAGLHHTMAAVCTLGIAGPVMRDDGLIWHTMGTNNLVDAMGSVLKTVQRATEVFAAMTA
jgi:hypothetical protein